jgi:hypothetical protein
MLVALVVEGNKVHYDLPIVYRLFIYLLKGIFGYM